MSSQSIKKIPQDLQAERAVLGCILIDNNSISDILEYISEHHFYDNNHKVIFKAILDLYDNFLLQIIYLFGHQAFLVLLVLEYF